MFVKDNQVISRICAFNGLLFNSDGLFYLVDKGGFLGGYSIPLTTDDKLICELIGLDHDKVTNANYDEFFKMVTESPNFFKDKFIEDSSDGRCNILGLFSEYLKKSIENKTLISIKRNRLDIEYIVNFFKDEIFVEQYTKIIKILSRKHLFNKNFSGSVILTINPNYNKSKLNITIPYFTKNYPRIERDYLILFGTPEEIVSEFEKFTNHLIV